MHFFIDIYGHSKTYTVIKIVREVKRKSALCTIDNIYLEQIFITVGGCQSICEILFINPILAASLDSSCMQLMTS